MEKKNNIDVRFEEKAKRFTVRLDGKIAYLTFKRDDENQVVFDHTYVPEEYREQGIAGKLVEAGMDWAKQEELKVVPKCSYVEWWVGQNPEYNEIIVSD
jgi:hypothetical protein